MGQARLTEGDHSGEWPELLREAAKNAQLDHLSWQPMLIEMDQPDAEARLNALLRAHRIVRVTDNYDEQFGELIVSRHPQLYRATLQVKRESLKEYLEEHYEGKPAWKFGTWVYFPWSGILTHVLERALFLESRTIRNKNLLTTEQQETYAAFTVGCAGMSVGSNVALTLAITGGSQRMKIADGAVISASNLNRIMAGVDDVGSPKSLVVARKLYEMNPYMEIARTDGDVVDKTIAEFFEQPWPLNAVVDEIDDLKVKILLRVEARKRRIPVIMATDLGDNVMLDVERFDLEPDRPLFHGHVPDIERLLENEVSKQEWLKYAMAIIGPKNVPLDLQKSLLKVGTQLVTQPQLGGTALMSGVVASFAIRQIALGGPLKSGRSMVSLDDALLERSFGDWYALHRHTRQLEKALGAM